MERSATSRKTIKPISQMKRTRIKTTRAFHKSKTAAELLRPVSTQNKDFYTLSRLMPNYIKQDKEKLFEENLMLKSQSNEILGENLQLKTRIKQLESKRKKKEESDPGLTLISTLKQNIQELKEKIQQKDEEMASLRRNVRVCKLDEMEAEVEAYREECTRLSTMLNTFMEEKEIPAAHLEYENKIYNKTQANVKLKKELQETQIELAQVKDELSISKEKNANLEKKQRRNSPKSTEISTMRDEFDNYKILAQKSHAELKDREKRLIEELEHTKDSLDKLNLKHKALEKDHEETSSVLEGLKKQIAYLKDENFRTQDNPHSSNYSSIDRLKNPPRLFKKIYQIAKERNLLMSVYLSLLDKNNNGLIEAEELRRGIVLHGKLVKKKHVNDLLSLLKITNKLFPLSILEEWIEKYEYEDHYSSSSDEETKPSKVIIEKLSFKSVNPDPKYNELVIPEVVALPSLPKEKKITLIKLEEISQILERIILHMQIKYVPKSRFLTAMFGNSFNPDVPVDSTQITEVLTNGAIFLGDSYDVKNFSLFLVEPEGVESLLESEHKKLKKNVLQFSKKLQKFIPNWEVIDRYKAQLEAYPLMTLKKELILANIQQVDTNRDGLIGLKDFNHLLHSHKSMSEQALRHMYLLSYSSSKTVSRIAYADLFVNLEVFQEKIVSLANKHKAVLDKIRDALSKAEDHFNKIFGYENEFLVGMDKIIEVLKALGVEVDDGFLGDFNIGRYTCDLGMIHAVVVQGSEEIQ